ncbi:uncharacterized protein LOC113204168 [Frankliniella occidentalis]|uniref:Uncharacterized protein LOC113204168 n=1 Tax=Frankliniella occidentalis TaxID=133901 RepID=A0A6J1S6Z6_FRAOC|nr:uncharacterized protein LOC113204168 [Frankliniella occidentalis]XP_026275000.1 uncharacterized protein LOC113204168 [Frankliniella occidentalis]XP_052123808.1 uncharacterized protein LOC113204168 [Frankliniella occidentalis]XP_052123814.1 uncharacterized protein LOC113204168 [Frankliniella occidentalis]
MEFPSTQQSPRDPLMDQLSINRRINNYKECCYRAYGFGLSALSIAAAASYFSLKLLPLRTTHIIMLSGIFGSVAGYKVSKMKSEECNLILKSHRESMKNPVQPEATEL